LEIVERTVESITELTTYLGVNFLTKEIKTQVQEVRKYLAV
jgi:hypothetical protein